MGLDGNQLRHALLRLLALGREGSALPAAQLRWVQDERGEPRVDCSEVWAAANLHSLDEAGLKGIAAKASVAGLLPPELGERTNPAARKKLKEVLEAWVEELGFGEGSSGRFAAFRAYRAECRSMVEQALQKLLEEELQEEGSWGQR